MSDTNAPPEKYGAIPEKYVTISERKFLKDFVLILFNFQMELNGSKSILDKNSTIKSIEPAPNYQVAYQISTARLNDYLRVQVHFNFDKTDSLLPFRSKVEPPYANGSLVDEVWESTGTINKAHLDFTNYTFQTLADDAPDGPVLLKANHEPFRLKNGAYISLVRSP